MFILRYAGHLTVLLIENRPDDAQYLRNRVRIRRQFAATPFFATFTLEAFHIAFGDVPFEDSFREPQRIFLVQAIRVAEMKFS
jgi:hypothetical protein